ncbi:hypothetical protein DL767_009241 [Monosporascus sp. MG133]|nr:hypothetical protein DL767_009241 [Monosporascus sp. MG133]
MEAKAKERETLASRARGKEALDHAIAAAELYMKAARDASSATEKARFKKRCEDMISMAERLKLSSRPDSVAAVERRLKLPRSSRQIPTGEKNILFRGSRLHGNVFPPWESDPDPKEFGGPPFIDPSEFSFSERQSEVFAGWKRPLELVQKDAEADEERMKSRLMESNGDYDLVQDITTDCSVVASLCASINHLRPGPTSILPLLMFPINAENGQPQISASGKYIFRMFFNGCFRKVVIDDRLPTSSTDRTLYVVDRQNPGLIWPALMEKAYLKVRGGYDFPGSNSGTDLWVLTGWIPQQIFLQSDDVDFNQTWRRVKKAYDYGDVVVTLGTGRLSPDEEEMMGLAGEHDYAVLDMSETSGNRKLLVKNPWCDGLVWKGVGSSVRVSPDDDDAKEQPAKLKPGTFWIGFDDVVQNFESLYLNWNPSLFTERQDHHFTWQLPEPNMANSFAHNPQYSMEAQADGNVWILLSRHFQDAELDIARSRQAPTTTLAAVSNRLGFMSLYIFASNDGGRVQLPDNKAIYRGPFVDSPQTLAPFEAKRGVRYTVAVASQDLPLPRYSFTLTFFSRAPLAVHLARDPLPHYAEVSSAWTRRTAGGNAASPTYSANPQFSLRVPPGPGGGPGPLSLLLSTARDDLPVHVGLVWAGGARVSALTQRDLVASSGDYRRGCALAEIPGVDPGVYTVVCSTFDPGHLADFTLRVGSASPCSLTPVPADAAGRLRLRLPNLVFLNPAAASSNKKNTLSPLSTSSSSTLTLIDPGVGGARSSVDDDESRAETTTTTRLGKRAAVEVTRLTRASVVVSPPNNTGTGTTTPTTTAAINPGAAASPRRSPAVRLRVVYGSGPNRTVLAATGDGEFREVGRGGLRTPEFDIEPLVAARRGVWLVAEQIGLCSSPSSNLSAPSSWQGIQQATSPAQQQQDEGGLQVEIFSDAHVRVGEWETVDV